VGERVVVGLVVLGQVAVIVLLKFVEFVAGQN
jgi:hypothetical protein